MARKTRIELEGALYHVVVRGNQKQLVFISDDDYQKYLSVLFQYRGRYKFAIFAYVLMSNHVHLLVRTAKVPLSKIMQGINQSYTVYFNRKYGTVGHLFQGRYRAVLCDGEKYLLGLIKYIHLNPVRAGRTATPDDYRWSSQLDYTEGPGEFDLTETSSVLRLFGDNAESARKLYRQYIYSDEAVDPEYMHTAASRIILGDDRFIRKLQKKRPLSGLKAQDAEYPLSEIADAIEGVYGVSLEEIHSHGKSRALSKGKLMLSLVAHECGYKGRQIAEFIRKDPVVVTRHLKEKLEFAKETGNVIAHMRKARKTASGR